MVMKIRRTNLIRHLAVFVVSSLRLLQQFCEITTTTRNVETFGEMRIALYLRIQPESCRSSPGINSFDSIEWILLHAPFQRTTVKCGHIADAILVDLRFRQAE